MTAVVSSGDENAKKTLEQWREYQSELWTMTNSRLTKKTYSHMISVPVNQDKYLIIQCLPGKFRYVNKSDIFEICRGRKNVLIMIYYCI